MKKVHTVPVNCSLCRLSETRTNIVPGNGPTSSRIMFIGEAPGRDEDHRGQPFVGSAGATLNRALADVGVSREDVFVTNIVKCRPPGNRKPSDEEIEACARYLSNEVRLVEPTVICLLGQTVTRELLGSTEKMSDIVGKVEDRTICGVNAKCVVTYHPAACLYRRGNFDSFRDAIGKALKLAGVQGGKRR